MNQATRRPNRQVSPLARHKRTAVLFGQNLNLGVKAENSKILFCLLLAFYCNQSAALRPRVYLRTLYTGALFVCSALHTYATQQESYVVPVVAAGKGLKPPQPPQSLWLRACLPCWSRAGRPRHSSPASRFSPHFYPKTKATMPGTDKEWSELSEAEKVRRRCSTV